MQQFARENAMKLFALAAGMAFLMLSPAGAASTAGSTCHYGYYHYHGQHYRYHHNGHYYNRRYRCHNGHWCYR
jgi:hypothetical protein